MFSSTISSVRCSSSLRRTSLARARDYFKSCRRSIHSDGQARFPIPPSLQSILLSRIDSERDRVKRVIKGQYGKKVLGESTIERCLHGGQDIPAIYAQYDGQELATLTKNFVQNNTSFESVLWYLLTHSFYHHNHHHGRQPVEEESASLFVQHLEERRQRRLQDKHSPTALLLESTRKTLISTLPREVTGQVVLAMLLMHQQPSSSFYLHRKETKKTDLHGLIVEDILDVIVTLPDLIDLANHIVIEKEKVHPCGKLHAQTSSKPWHILQSNTYTDRVKEVLLQRNNDQNTTSKQSTIDTKTVQDALIHELIHSFDGGKVLMHTPRLVSCTLSDPYLAMTSTSLAFHSPVNYGKSTDGSVNEYRCDAVMKGTSSSVRGSINNELAIAMISRLTAGLVEVYWDRALMFSLENPKSMDMPSLLEYTK